MTIKRMDARIADVADLSTSAREVTLQLPEPIGFSPGAFVNVFLEREGKKERRAYSISSSARAQDRIALTIRKGSPGGMSERFWEPSIERVPLSIMGPLGLNTIECITKPRVFLFGFGIGVSVVKGLVEDLLARSWLTELTIVTGSRTEEEVLYREFFDSLNDTRLHTRFVISRPKYLDYPYRGYIQDHVADLRFDGASVYLCGQGSACTTLRAVIENSGAEGVEFLVESFDS